MPCLARDETRTKEVACLLRCSEINCAQREAFDERANRDLVVGFKSSLEASNYYFQWAFWSVRREKPLKGQIVL